MSPRRMLATCPVAGLTTRIGSARIASTDWNAPATRTCTFCVPASTTPEPWTAFCALSCATTWLMSMPISAARFCGISTKTFCDCTPNNCTLATSGTRSSCERTSSARWRSSSSLKPSAESAKIEP